MVDRMQLRDRVAAGRRVRQRATCSTRNRVAVLDLVDRQRPPAVAVTAGERNA